MRDKESIDNKIKNVIDTLNEDFLDDIKTNEDYANILSAVIEECIEIGYFYGEKINAGEKLANVDGVNFISFRDLIVFMVDYISNKMEYIEFKRKILGLISVLRLNNNYFVYKFNTLKSI